MRLLCSEGVINLNGVLGSIIGTSPFVLATPLIAWTASDRFSSLNRLWCYLSTFRKILRRKFWYVSPAPVALWLSLTDSVIFRPADWSSLHLFIIIELRPFVGMNFQSVSDINAHPADDVEPPNVNDLLSILEPAALSLEYLETIWRTALLFINMIYIIIQRLNVNESFGVLFESAETALPLFDKIYPLLLSPQASPMFSE